MRPPRLPLRALTATASLVGAPPVGWLFAMLIASAINNLLPAGPAPGDGPVFLRPVAALTATNQSAGNATQATTGDQRSTANYT